MGTILQMVFSNQVSSIGFYLVLSQILVKFGVNGLIYNNIALVQIMAWRRTGQKA